MFNNRNSKIGLLILIIVLAACAQGGSEPEVPADELATAAATTIAESLTETPLAETATFVPSPTSSATPEENATAGPSPEATSAPTNGQPVIEFERSGGFAGDATQWQLYGDGTLQITHDPGNANATVEETSVDPAAVQTLLDSLQELDFFDLDGNYVPKNSCCDRFNYVLTVRSDGQEQRVETVGGTEDVPAEVWESIELVEQFLQDAGVETTSER